MPGSDGAIGAVGDILACGRRAGRGHRLAALPRLFAARRRQSDRIGEAFRRLMDFQVRLRAAGAGRSGHRTWDSRPLRGTLRLGMAAE